MQLDEPDRKSSRGYRFDQLRVGPSEIAEM